MTILPILQLKERDLTSDLFFLIGLCSQAAMLTDLWGISLSFFSLFFRSPKKLESL